MRRAVFLDRDGVINEVVLRNGRPYPPPSVDAMVFLPGTQEAIVSLRQGGYFVIVVTNQPDVGTGVQRREVVEAMHERIRTLFAVDDIRVCYHTESEGCACRKPRPGMLLTAASRWAIALDQSYMVGDRWRDVGAGRNAGCRTILLGTGYGEPLPYPPDARAESLPAATRLILSESLSTTS